MTGDRYPELELGSPRPLTGYDDALALVDIADLRIKVQTAARRRGWSLWIEPEADGYQWRVRRPDGRWWTTAGCQLMEGFRPLDVVINYARGKLAGAPSPPPA